MSADLLREAADRLVMHPGRVVEIDLSEVLPELLECFAEAYDFCAARWVDADEAARDKVHGYEEALDIARLILGERDE